MQSSRGAIDLWTKLGCSTSALAQGVTREGTDLTWTVGGHPSAQKRLFTKRAFEAADVRKRPLFQDRSKLFVVAPLILSPPATHGLNRVRQSDPLAPASQSKGLRASNGAAECAQ
eukprot:1831028-Rhodomonas_salina.1